MAPRSKNVIQAPGLDLGTGQMIEPSSPDQYDFEEVLKRLSEPLPSELIKQKPSHRDRNGNNVMADYIEWFTAADILDAVYPYWTNTIELKPYGDTMVAVVGLTICGVTRYGVGVGDVGKEMGIKKAEHDGLKRAAIKFGLARELYHREATYEETEGAYAGTSETGFPANPLATSENDRVTVKQLGMIKARCRNLNIDPEAECFAAMQIEMDSMSKKAASAFIDHIGRLETGAAASLQQPVSGVDTSAEYNQTASSPAAIAHFGKPAPLPPMPPARQPQAASAAQGRMTTPGQVVAIRKIGGKIGYADEDVALEYSNQRTNDLTQLSEAEAANAIKLLQGA